MTADSAAICLLGPPIEHRESLLAMLGDTTRKVVWVPDSITFHKQQAHHSASRPRRAMAQLAGTRNPQYLELLGQTIDAADAKLVIAYWGTNPLPDLLALQRLRPQVKLVLMVLCHPLAVGVMGIMRQDFLMHRMASVLDGVLFPSKVMAAYFQPRLFPVDGPAAQVIYPYWPRAFQATTPMPAMADHPTMAFTGRTDLSSSTINVSDDIRPLMREILDAGIELHHGRSPETDDGHPLRRPFQPLPPRDLIRMLGGLDASLVAYNTNACPRDDRFQLTVPDRLITSVTAGIPIAIPRHGYAAAREYLANYPAVIEFDAVTELRQALDDRENIAKLRAAAWKARAAYCAEEQGATLRAFVDRLIGQVK